MPACSSENYPRFWSPPPSRSSSASPPLPSSPISKSPPSLLEHLPSSVSPIPHKESHISTLKRSTSNLSNSIVINSPRRRSQLMIQNNHQSEQQRAFLPVRIFTWYLGMISSVIQWTLNTMGYAIWAPGLWASAWVCLFWIMLQLPLTILKWFITILHTPASERSRNKRCVLISGGSTVQTVRLAQNFYKAGARVVVFDLEGLFALAKYSTACSKYYTVPKPGPGSAAEYVKALKDIVQRERAAYYIPVCATSPAYYDALAKQYLEIMGCECFVPGAAEVTVLDDPLELMRRCRSLGLATPTNFVLRTEDDVTCLYETGSLRTGRHVMLAAGPAGMRDRTKITLPPTVREFRHQEHEISERRPWMVIRDPGGSHFITCTTIKDSKVVANITCRVDEIKGLIPEERIDVNHWLERFFTRTFGSRINGHLSFRLAISRETGELISIGCRVGIGLPYICHTSVHPRLVWRPCKHFSRHNSGPLVIGERPLNQEAIATALKSSSCENTSRLLGTVLDKRQALFVYWDPLPYCAYYYLQLPFRRVAGVIRAQPGKHNPPLAVVR